MVSRQMVATDPVLEPGGSVGSPKNHLLRTRGGHTGAPTTSSTSLHAFTSGRDTASNRLTSGWRHRACSELVTP